jgi:NADPH:quinone reductase-like Zn-dependent oxidoreductase
MKYKHTVVSQFGGPENLLLAEGQIPEPRANELRVKVLADRLNFGKATHDRDIAILFFNKRKQ